MFDDEIITVASELVQQAIGYGIWVTTAESCTGGLIAGALTSISGASSCVSAGYVTYSNDAKMKALQVSDSTLKEFGAVSGEVAQEMAIGARRAASADLALAVTGIAGPDGGSIEKPVGLVFVAASGGVERSTLKVEEHRFGDIGRSEVRRETVLAALQLGLSTLKVTL